MGSIKPWRRMVSEVLGDHRIFRLRRDDSESEETGRRHRFHVLEMPAWVNVVPVTPDGRVVLIRQYRHGTEEVTLEIPGGMVDPGESPAASARRELREETGYDAAEIVPLGSLTPNPAIQDNRIHTFLARGARRAGAQDLQGAEEIDVTLAPLADIPELIRSGEIHHALVVAAFYLLDRAGPGDR